ncbi:MAG: pentapeptide repeat-containing protein [Clostridia bacterium]|nr:pentapeptide repeat-containing protein [Clostridia bacterium]
MLQYGDEVFVMNFFSACSACRGLCCSELFFFKSDGFPSDKKAGEPCRHLRPDFRCEVHGLLAERGLTGCLAYDCLGAGPVACAACASGDVRTAGVFSALYRLHEMLWYLTEVPCPETDSLAAETEALTRLAPAALLSLDLDAHRIRVNAVLRPLNRALASLPPPKGDLIGRDFHRADLSGTDFSMALLLGANLSGCMLQNASFLGADLRGVDFRGADLSESRFLTPRQLASAKGDGKTKRPARLERPGHWGK